MTAGHLTIDDLTARGRAKVERVLRALIQCPQSLRELQATLNIGCAYPVNTLLADGAIAPLPGYPPATTPYAPVAAHPLVRRLRAENAPL